MPVAVSIEGAVDAGLGEVELAGMVGDGEVMVVCVMSSIPPVEATEVREEGDSDVVVVWAPARAVNDRQATNVDRI